MSGKKKSLAGGGNCKSLSKMTALRSSTGSVCSLQRKDIISALRSSAGSGRCSTAFNNGLNLKREESISQSEFSQSGSKRFLTGNTHFLTHYFSFCFFYHVLQVRELDVMFQFFFRIPTNLQRVLFFSKIHPFLMRTSTLLTNISAIFKGFTRICAYFKGSFL